MQLVIPGLACTFLTGCFDSPPQIIALTPNRGSIGVPADTPIEVQFDRPVVPSSVAGRFSVSSPVSSGITGCNLNAAFSAPPGAACRIIWTNGDSDFVLQHPGAILAPDTQYTFTLRGGFRDPAGAVNTVDHTWFITTAGAPEVRAVNPADGASGVPVDAPLTIDFNTGMDPTTTEAAIRLDPAVPGTRVIANTRDKSRFMLLPGHPLEPAVTYRLSVSPMATDEHGQPLVLPVTIAFTAGGVSPGGHALVLVRSSGQAPTQVLLTALSAVEDGLPIASEVALSSPTCAAEPACGAAPFGAPLYTFTAAALSPDNRWLAVVEQDQTSATAATTLLVVDAASRALHAAIPGGSLPSWSPDGGTLAFAAGGTVSFFQPGSGRTTTLPPGDPILSPPVWSPLGELLVLDEQGADGEHVELADSVAGARYPVPGITGVAGAAVISTDGRELALHRSGPGVSGTWLVGLGSSVQPARRLDPSLIPFGFTDPGTLVALSTARGASVSLVRVSVAGDEQIPIPAAAEALLAESVVVSPSGRQLGYLAFPGGATNAYVENADGSGPVALTAFLPGTVDAAGLSING